MLEKSLARKEGSELSRGLRTFAAGSRLDYKCVAAARTADGELPTDTFIEVNGTEKLRVPAPELKSRE
jgi:hypothetical protein